jgi:endonuclease YncB( thermonuclease family)
MFEPQHQSTSPGSRAPPTKVHNLALAIVLILALPASATPLVGVPSVIDGDTIEIHGERIRLNGIDAPESAQLCTNAAGKTYRCGQVASLALAEFLKAHGPTACIEVDRDKFRRKVAVCTAKGTDIGEWMVRQGYALDWPKYSAGFYIGAETEARAAKRGIWAGSFERPWQWRKRMTVN